MGAVEDYISTLQAWIEARPVAPAPMQVRLPATIEDGTDDAEPAIGYAEGQAFMIEYLDSLGGFSRRRIVVWGIRDGGLEGIPSLYAKCLERNAMRSFRIDRIKACIDFDGEVHDDVPKFMAETFGMDMSSILAEAALNKDGRWIDALGLMRHDAVLIASVVRADGFILSSETEIAAEYLEVVAERGSFYATEEEHKRIRAYVKRLRPRKDAVAAAIAAIQRRPLHHIAGLFRVLVMVMDADGKRHPDEVALINGLGVEILGTMVV